MVSIDTFFFMAAKFLSLCMENLKTQFFKINGSKDELKILIERHKKIINCCEFLREIYLPIIVAEYILTAIGITFLGFQIIMVRKNITIEL